MSLPCRVAAFAFVGVLWPIAAPLLAQLEPREAHRALEAAEELQVELFASEPMITNPAAIDVDTHGRVWVAEIQWYRRSAKQPPADKIKVLEDTTGDGRADKVTTFAEGVFCPMSICVAGDKVYVATSPDLWVFEDKDGDLKADGPPTKLLTGFGGFNHDHAAHSLVLGPDHKWWMSHGDHGFDVTGTDGSHIQYQWGAVLRGELDGSQLEIVARNFRNPYEVCVSSFGEAFCSDNDNDGLFSTRICWIMEGGDYGWFGRPGPRVPAGTPFAEGWHFRAPVPGYVPGTLVTGFGSPCGICFYEGDAFGPELKNLPWHTDNGPREVRAYRHVTEGAGMRASSRVLITSSDAYFRPDDVCAAPDGSLFVSDWYDGGVGGHAYNNPDQGRIYRIRPKGTSLARREPPGPYNNVPDAIAGLQSPNLATQYLARQQLLEAGPASLPALTALLDDPEPNFRARALWVLDRIGGAARTRVIDQLASGDAAFRALAVRILRRHGNEHAREILSLVGDSSAEVRREVLLALPALDGAQAESALIALAKTYDGSDRYLLEAIHIAARGREQRLYEALRESSALSASNLQLLQLLDAGAAVDLLARQLRDSSADAQNRQRTLGLLASVTAREALQATLDLLADSTAHHTLRSQALDAVRTNLAGLWGEWARDEAVAKVARQLLIEPAFQAPAVELVATAGLTALAGDVADLAARQDLPLELRQAAIATIGQLRSDGAVRQLRGLLEEPQPALRAAAVAALVEVQDWQTLRQLVSSQDPSPLRDIATQQLMQSTTGALTLRKWIEEQAVPVEVRDAAVALAIAHPDANVRTIYEAYIPADQRPQRLGEAISADEILALSGDARRGEQIFFHSSAAQCNNCHRVRGFGKDVGPDLTQIGKKYAPAALLETILDPSKAIGPEYIVHVVETADGQMLAGFVVSRDEREIILKDAQGRRSRVRARDVVAIEASPKSMMPDLVLRDITAQDAADLLAYLLTLTEPVDAP